MDEDLKISFNTIIGDSKQRIMRICRAYAHNDEDQKDLFQEVAFNIWKSLPSFRQEAAVNTWVYRVCLNVCMQYAVKRNKAKWVHENIDGIEIFDDGADMQQNLERQEKSKRLHECIQNLNDAEKSLILLFLEDVAYKTIAEVMGLTENHVAVKLGRIKKKLSNCINN